MSSTCDLWGGKKKKHSILLFFLNLAEGSRGDSGSSYCSGVFDFCAPP